MNRLDFNYETVDGVVVNCTQIYGTDTYEIAIKVYEDWHILGQYGDMDRAYKHFKIWKRHADIYTDRDELEAMAQHSER